MLGLMQTMKQIKADASKGFRKLMAKDRAEKLEAKKNGKFIDLNKGIDLEGLKAIASDDDAESQLTSLLDIVDQLFYDVFDYNDDEKFLKEKCACNLYFSMRAIDTIITNFIDIDSSTDEEDFYNHSDYLDAYDEANFGISQACYELYANCVKLRDEIAKLSDEGKFKAVDYLGLEMKAMSEQLTAHVSRLVDKADRKLRTDEFLEYGWSEMK